MPDESPTRNVIAIGIGARTFHVLEMLKDDLGDGIKTILVDHEESTLKDSKADVKLKIGKSMKGLGACPNPEIGKSFAELSENEIRGSIESSDVIFLIGESGDNFVAGALPEVARYSRDKSRLIISLLWYPFYFEGKKIGEFAEYCIHNSKEHSDGVIVMRVQNIPKLTGRISFESLFQISYVLSFYTLKSIIHPFVEVDVRCISETMETFSNSALGEPAIGYSDRPGNEGIDEAVDKTLNKGLTDLDYGKAEKVYYNILLRNSSNNYDTEKAKGVILGLFPKSNMVIRFYYLKDIEDEAVAVFLIIKAPKRIPTIEELGMDVID